MPQTLTRFFFNAHIFQIQRIQRMKKYAFFSLSDYKKLYTVSYIQFQMYKELYNSMYVVE